MHNKWYSIFKHVLIGPFLRVWNRPELEGVERIPTEGPIIMASSHQSVMDSFYFPLMCPRQMVFPAKKEYFTAPGVVGAIQRWFFKAVNQIPIDRDADNAGESLMAAGKKVLGEGGMLGIYPEGTRSPDGRVYRGRTGAARVALATGVKIVPVGMIGSRDANPIGTWVPRPRKVRMKVGELIDPVAYVRSQGLEPDDRQAPRALTDHIMQVLKDLVGAEYVDVYASEVKKSLEAGKGYPAGTEPR
ncbi:1-acyl-sn-glycerol-3-phosphate acyltransferase [Corynebacterium occultum]|uniref:1-acyl-sn-glycerol-3-phosphate acyltransferase n=1 Tax=Corynebacterium occultum TaxID=2675219 RepID=A0A6B8W7C4_9CORY|nr:lysophospholipid acyltransferase family protein [Corynebacterium occultum]QGU07827.1 1-acyl-sn-glycerol-3-phosphate acyltransferase [Corynebacterium occultum]